MPFVAAGILAASAISGAMSASAQKDAAENATAAQQQSIAAVFAKLDAVGMPPDQSARVILQQYQQAGILTPALMQQVQQAQSQYQNVKQNSTAVNLQTQALQRMSQMGQAGLTPDEMAQQRQAQLQAAGQGNQAQQAIIQQMQQRGMQGSGAEIAAQLGAAQNAANQQSSAADQTSATASQRALQAIAQTGSMGSQLEQQSWGEQSQQASAEDQMNRFNIQNQMGVNQYNTTAQNQAQAANLANAQQISNANTSGYNQESYNQLQRQMQDWQAKLQYASAYSQPLQAYGQAGAQGAYGVGNAQSNMYSGIGSGVSSGLGVAALGGAFNSTPTTNGVNNSDGQYSVGSGTDANEGVTTPSYANSPD